MMFTERLVLPIYFCVHQTFLNFCLWFLLNITSLEGTTLHALYYTTVSGAVCGHLYFPGVTASCISVFLWCDRQHPVFLYFPVVTASCNGAWRKGGQVCRGEHRKAYIYISVCRMQNDNIGTWGLISVIWSKKRWWSGLTD